MEFFGQIDLPNLVAGVLGTALFGFLISVVKKRIRYDKADVSIKHNISGTWYSAEYDYKTEGKREYLNTFLKVSVTRGLFGKVDIISLEEEPKGKKKVKKTSWAVKGKLRGNTFSGEWESNIDEAQRYGSVFLQFIDHGRAVGYWIGLSHVNHPVYGYWIMVKERANEEEDSRKELRKIARKILFDYNFVTIDVPFLVENIDKPQIPEEIYKR